MKFIIAYDTICQGWQCMKGEDESPILFDSELEAWKEILDGAIAHAVANHNTEFSETSAEQLSRMRELDATGSLEDIKRFLNDNPECNEYDEFVVEEKDFVLGRKSIFAIK